MRKALIFSVALMLALPGLGLAQKKDPKDMTIGASLISKDNMWWANVGKFLEQAAKAKGVKLIVLWAQGDVSKQLKDVEDLIQRKVDGLIIGPVHGTGSVQAFEAAWAAKIPTIDFARAVETDKFAASVVADETMFGIKQAEFIASRLPNGGKLVYLFGPVGASYPAIQFEGFQNELKKYPHIEILEVYKSKVDTMAEGLRNAEDALVRFPKIDAFVGSNDDLTLGALRAAESAGRAKDIIFVGNSGLPMGMQAIYEGKMHYTALKSQAAMISTALDMLIKVIQGEKVDKDIKVPPIPVTKENVLTVKDPVFGGTVDNPATFTPQK
ncbi:MAG: sugar ABC transporter substrate-binding protein [bacterium]